MEYLLNQRKLTRNEWETVEKPIEDNEKMILKMITEGYANPDISFNTNISLFCKLNAEFADKQEIHKYLYSRYFEPIISNMFKTVEKASSKLKSPPPLFQQFNTFIAEWIHKNKIVFNLKKMKKADEIRMQNLHNNISTYMQQCVEQFYVDRLQSIVSILCSGKTEIIFDVYTLHKILPIAINHINPHVHKLLS